MEVYVKSTAPYSQLRMLAVHAHPDDESSKGGATTALYTTLGAQVTIATMTGGEAGSILNPALEGSPAAIRDIAGLRRDEMARAAQRLGAQHKWIGFVDSGLPEGGFDDIDHGTFWTAPTEVAARPLVHLIRQLRPHVVTTYDELGGYPHPDHIRAHEATMLAVQMAADADCNPELGEAWQVPKVYYNMDLTPAKWMHIHGIMAKLGAESPLSAERQERIRTSANKRDYKLTASIPAGAFLETAAEALRAHATQIDPSSGFFSEVQMMAEQYWPTEEFELAVDNTGRDGDFGEFSEHDLFEGITLEDGTVVAPGDLKAAMRTAGIEIVEPAQKLQGE